jgi:hypothetical protein
MFGSGLVTLSRYPIIRHQFWRYAAGGFATAISCGDYYAGKGVWQLKAVVLGYWCGALTEGKGAVDSRRLCYSHQLRRLLLCRQWCVLLSLVATNL